MSATYEIVRLSFFAALFFLTVPRRPSQARVVRNGR